MLTLSKQTDYALLALSYLTSAATERPASTREISEQFDIPLEHLAKVLQKLARASLINSTPGPTGGYRLRLPAEEITVANVIECIDGRPALAQCFRTDHSDCGQINKCTIRKPLERINERLFEMLDLISLAEINAESARPGEMRSLKLTPISLTR